MGLLKIPQYLWITLCISFVIAKQFITQTMTKSRSLEIGQSQSDIKQYIGDNLLLWLDTCLWQRTNFNCGYKHPEVLRNRQSSKW
jgi:hypothetical protein